MSDILVSATRDILNPNSMTFEEREKDLEEQAKQEEQARKRAKNSPFSNFYQFNRAQTKNVILLASRYPKAQTILLFLLDQMDEYNAVVCSYKVLQEALGMSQATVARAIKVLKDTNFIAVFKCGTANLYSVNKTLAWSSWGTNYKYAKFDAKILISETEQIELAKTGVIKHKEITLSAAKVNTPVE